MGNLQELIRLRDDMEKELNAHLAFRKQVDDLEKQVLALEEAKGKYQKGKENTDCTSICTSD